MTQSRFEKIQKSFGETFNVPSPLYVPGLNVLALSLVVLIQRASIVCINEIYSFSHSFQSVQYCCCCFFNLILLLCPSSRYSHFVKRRNKISRFHGQRVIKKLNSSTSVQPRLAVFFAYFRPDLSTILRLMCCPAHLQGKQIKKLKKEGIRRPIYSNSKKDMTPGYDKAFVLVSGGIRLHEEQDMEGIYLR